MSEPKRSARGRAEGAETGASRWNQLWRNRTVTHAGGSVLATLLAADGYATPFGAVDETSWIEFVDRRATDLGIGAGSSVFEVGCGAGAYLYELQARGCRVGGIDLSEELIRIARSVVPGDYEVKDAQDLDIRSPVDVVVACSVFQYFPSLEYARFVIERMVAAAGHAVGIFDLPDEATKGAALEYRKSLLGGASSYEQAYEGLEHCHFQRGWIADIFRSCGLAQVRVVDQDLARYGMAPYRFNAWGLKVQGRAGPVEPS
jgi:SAM-dependent methyltransferase